MRTRIFALLGVALGTVLLPSLVRHHNSEDRGAYSRLLDWGLRVSLMLALPAAVALAMLAVPLIATLFWHGQFLKNDVFMTRNALVGYAVGLAGIILVKVLAPGFYAKQNIRTPVKVAVVTLVVTQLLNVVFVYYVNLKHAGLALSISVGACFNAAWLWWLMRRSGAAKAAASANRRAPRSRGGARSARTKERRAANGNASA